MTNFSEERFSEEYAKQAVIEQLGKMFPEATSEIEKLEEIIKNDKDFNPNDVSAEIFGHPEMSLKSYVASKIKNVRKALTYFSGDMREKTLRDRYDMLVIKYNKVFNPETFITRTIEFITGKIVQVQKSMRSTDDVATAFYQSDLVNAISELNTYFERNASKNIDVPTLTKIKEINEELKNIPMPLIEINAW